MCVKDAKETNRTSVSTSELENICFSPLLT